MATETLAIKVTDNGSSRAVANEFKSMAREIMQAGRDLSSMKKQMKGFSGGFNGEVRKVNKELNKVGASTRSAKRGIDSVSRSAKAAKGPLRSLASSMSSLRGVAFSLGGVFAAGQFLNMSDQFQNMENRIKLVTNSTAEFNAVQSRLFAISKDTRQSVSATVETFVRLRKATLDAGVPTERLFGVMKTLNQMLAISGATSQESEQAMRQLSQAFSKGFLNGDEFRTLSEAMPDVLTALQTSLGVTQGELRKMSEAGTLTTDVLLNAFEAVKTKVDGQFKTSVKTFGQAWQLLKDEVLKTVGELNKSTGIIGVVMGAMSLLANHLWIVVTALKALVLWIGVKLLMAIPGVVTALRVNFVQALAFARHHVALFSTTIKGSMLTGLNRFTGALTLAAAAGVAIGTAFSRTSVGGRVTDWLAGITDEDKASTLEQAFQAKHKRLVLEIKMIEQSRKMRQIAGIEDNAEHDKAITRNVERIDMLKRHAKAMIDAREEAKRLRKELLAASARDLQDKVNEEEASTIRGILGTMRPRLAAQEEFNAKWKQLHDTLMRTGAAGSVISDMFDELQSHYKKQMNPIETMIEKNEELTQVYKIQNKELREAALLNLKSRDAVIEAKGVGATQMGDDGKFKDPAMRDLQARLTKSEQDRLAAEARNNRGGRSRTPKTDNTLKELNDLVASMNPVFAAEQKIAEATMLMNKAFERNIPITKEMDAAFRMLNQQTEAARYPTKALIEEMNQMIATQHLSSDALSDLNAKQAEYNKLIATGASEEAVKMFQAEKQRIDAMRAYREKELVETDNPRQAFEDQARWARAALGDDRARIQIKNEMKTTIQGLTKELHAENIGLAEYNILVKEARRNANEMNQAITDSHSTFRGVKELLTDSAVEEMWINSVTNAFLALEDIAVASVIQIETALMDLATGATTDWDSFTTAMADMFHNAAEAMLQDITRILIRLAAMRLIQGAMGSPIPIAPANFSTGAMPNYFARHGKTFQSANLPHFAHGGQMQVGGSGGPDTKLVQFMASPGENIRVTNPGQSRLDNRAAAAASASSQKAPVVNVINQMNPNDMVSAMSTPAGTKAVLNIIQQNGPVVKRTLR